MIESPGYYHVSNWDIDYVPSEDEAIRFLRIKLDHVEAETFSKLGEGLTVDYCKAFYNSPETDMELTRYYSSGRQVFKEELEIQRK